MSSHALKWRAREHEDSNRVRLIRIAREFVPCRRNPRGRRGREAREGLTTPTRFGAQIRMQSASSLLSNLPRATATIDRNLFKEQVFFYYLFFL